MDWLSTAFGRLVGFLPQFIGGLVILVVAFVVGRVVCNLLRRVVAKVGFDGWLHRHGLIRENQPHGGSRALGTAAFWVIMLVGASAAARTWQLDIVADGLARVLAYLPHVFAAVLIFGAAWLVAEWLGDRAGQFERRPGMLRGAVKAVVLTLGGFMALQELRIAPRLVLIAFTLVLGAIAVACALAFGLGGRPAAARLTQRWAGVADDKANELEGTLPPRAGDEPRDMPPAHH